MLFCRGPNSGPHTFGDSGFYRLQESHGSSAAPEQKLDTALTTKKANLAQDGHSPPVASRN